jgi:poly-gamma-glutamate capsule biosynthesis protein CapA/YwtB (metallophosphatase superfamily)
MLRPGLILDPARPLIRELDAKAAPDIVVTLVGTIALSDDTALPAAFAPSVRALLRGPMAHPSVTLGALAGTILPPGGKAYPAGWDGPPLPPAIPGVARQLSTAGFDMLARADDHALDWGIEGMRETSLALDAAGVIHAGTGESGGLARSARYFDHPAGVGRIALVSVATSYRPNSEALVPQGAAPGRPGVAAIETGISRLVPAERLTEICAIVRRFGGGACDGSATLTALGSHFEQGSYESRLRLNPLQLLAALSAVRQGKQSADLMIVWIHAGELFPEDLARAAIDAGADIVAGSGGVPGAIELYAPPGRPPAPIFHDLGRFNGGRDAVIVQLSSPRGRRTIDIHPLATDPAQARSTLDRISALSAPYGTRIAILSSDGSLFGRVETAGTDR